MGEGSTFLRFDFDFLTFHQMFVIGDHRLSHFNRLTNNEGEVRCTHLRTRVTDTNMKKIAVGTKQFANLKPDTSIDEKEEERKSHFVLSHLSREMSNEDFLIIGITRGEVTFFGRAVIP